MTNHVTFFCAFFNASFSEGALPVTQITEVLLLLCKNVACHLLHVQSKSVLKSVTEAHA